MLKSAELQTPLAYQPEIEQTNDYMKNSLSNFLLLFVFFSNFLIIN